jgi:hypothetical protein
VLLVKVGEQLASTLVRPDAALDPGPEIAALGDHVGQRVLDMVVSGSRLLRCVIRQILYALNPAPGALFVLREQPLESLRM